MNTSKKYIKKYVRDTMLNSMNLNNIYTIKKSKIKNKKFYN